MKTFIIDRATWLRGEGMYSLLYRESDGQMCCLGQIACQFGYSKEEINGIASPQRMAKQGMPNKNKFYEKFIHIDNSFPENTLITLGMMEANDDNTIHDMRREEKLMELAAKLYIKLEFIN